VNQSRWSVTLTMSSLLHVALRRFILFRLFHFISFHFSASFLCLFPSLHHSQALNTQSDMLRLPHPSPPPEVGGADADANANVSANATADAELVSNTTPPGSENFSDPECRSTRYPQQLIPSEFTHLQLVFRSKNTLLFKARRKTLSAGTGLASPQQISASLLPLVRQTSNAHVQETSRQSPVSSSAGSSGPTSLAAAPLSTSASLRSQTVNSLIMREDLVVLKMPNIFQGGTKGNVPGLGLGIGIELGSQMTALDAEGLDQDALLQPNNRPRAAEVKVGCAVVAPGFSTVQQSKIKQFMHQYSIAKQLQNKNVPGLVQLRTHATPPPQLLSKCAVFQCCVRA
jgi:hypothetical protein